VAGVDEAGRGALAGPVVAAAVVFPQGATVPGVFDSKELPPQRREELLEEIERSALAVSWAHVGPSRIDKINILRSTHEAMRKSLEGLPQMPGLALIDGRPVPGLPCDHIAVVKGDRKSLSIAAASIVAKVMRDRIMTELCTRYPQYNLSSNKGYASREHLLAIRKSGPSDCHRKSFSPMSGSKVPRFKPELLPLET
jgi:ribonuclease HII